MNKNKLDTTEHTAYAEVSSKSLFPNRNKRRKRLSYERHHVATH